MTRATRFLALSTALLTSYLLVFFSILPIPFVKREITVQILPVIPWWLLITFGSYSLASLGLGLLSIRDCPEAYNELIAEITHAKMDLRANGIDVD